MNATADHLVDVTLDAARDQMVLGREAPVDRRSPQVEGYLEITDRHRVAAVAPEELGRPVQHLHDFEFGWTRHGFSRSGRRVDKR